MISLAGVDSCKVLAEILVNSIPGGAVAAVIEGDTITWAE